MSAPEDKVVDLMDALAASLEAAKKARRDHEAIPSDLCWRCANHIGGCMTEGCPGTAEVDR